MKTKGKGHAMWLRANDCGRGGGMLNEPGLITSYARE